MKKNAFIIFSLCVVVFLLGAGGFILYANQKFNKGGPIKILNQIPTPTPTPAVSPSPTPIDTTGLSSEALAKEDWKTYRNVKQGYSVKYPPNWYFVEKSDHVEFGEIGKEYAQEESPVYAVGIFVYPTPASQTIEKLKNQLTDKAEEYQGTLSTLILSGETVLEEKTYLGIQTYIIHSGKEYTVSTPFQEGDVASVYEAMRRSFQYIDKNSIDTTSWKTYKNKELGISFKYPNNWKDIVLNKLSYSENPTKIDTFYSTDTMVDIIYYDPENIFSFDIAPKGYKFPLMSTSINQRRVNVNWTAEEFSSNMSMSPIFDVLYTKKLSNKSMLVAIYSAPECSPGMGLKVITPLKEDYPNFEIFIVADTESDPVFKMYRDSQAKKGEVCDMSEGYKQVADRIFKGTFSEKLNSYIETARQIADSVTVIK